LNYPINRTNQQGNAQPGGKKSSNTDQGRFWYFEIGMPYQDVPRARLHAGR
jgi:hypothetical protein